MTQRPIKFRVWNPSDGAMIYRPDDVLVDWTNYFRPGKDLSENNSRLILMQFTGLHDKNGVEIWEGDVVKLTAWPWIRSNRPRVVEWDTQTGFSPFNEYCDNPDVTGYPPTGEWCEVIGNIHENPDLLTP